jgi:AcrR family transcriptional regulator
MRAVSTSDAETAGCIISSKSAGANIATSLEPIMRSNRSATDDLGVGAISIAWIAWSSIGAIDATDMSWESTDTGVSIQNDRTFGARRHQKLFWGQTAPKNRAGQVTQEASVTMVSVSAKRTYRGVAADERRAIRRVALMEAALDLFAEEGARGVSKRAICARARLNDRYFYEHFADADAVFEAMVQDGTARGLEAVNVASQKAAPDIHAQVQATAVAALDFLTSDPRLVQLLLRSHTSEVLQQARRESARAIARAMAAMINEPPSSSAGELDAEMAAYALVSGAMEVIAGWLRGEFETSQDHISAIVAGLLLKTADLSVELSDGLRQTM